jgi:hypothetical protein
VYVHVDAVTRPTFYRIQQCSTRTHWHCFRGHQLSARNHWHRNRSHCPCSEPPTLYSDNRYCRNHRHRLEPPTSYPETRRMSPAKRKAVQRSMEHVSMFIYTLGKTHKPSYEHIYQKSKSSSQKQNLRAGYERSQDPSTISLSLEDMYQQTYQGKTKPSSRL